MINDTSQTTLSDAISMALSMALFNKNQKTIDSATPKPADKDMITLMGFQEFGDKLIKQPKQINEIIDIILPHLKTQH